jgi:CBS-domain-containing membrane protein
METRELLTLKVGDVMSTELITVKQDTVLKDVNQIFENENIHHIPVVANDGHFMGIISKSDILLLLDWGTKLSLPASIRKTSSCCLAISPKMSCKQMSSRLVLKIPYNDVCRFLERIIFVHYLL